MNSIKLLEFYGFEDVIVLGDSCYEDALIGVTDDNRAVYDFEKMVNGLRNNHGWDYEEAVEWIEYNTIRALPYAGRSAPIIMYRLQE